MQLVLGNSRKLFEGLLDSMAALGHTFSFLLLDGKRQTCGEKEKKAKVCPESSMSLCCIC